MAQGRSVKHLPIHETVHLNFSRPLQDDIMNILDPYQGGSGDGSGEVRKTFASP